MNEARLYLGLSCCSTLKMVKKTNKSIPVTQLVKSVCLLEGQHSLGASESISAKVFVMQNLLYFTFNWFKVLFLRRCHNMLLYKVHCILIFLYKNTYKYISMCVLIQTKFRAVLTIIFWGLPFILLIISLCIWCVFSEFTLNQLPNVGMQWLLRCSLLSHQASSSCSRDLPMLCRPLCSLRVPKMTLETWTTESQLTTSSLRKMMEGEKHETLTWRFRFLAAAAHIAAFSAWWLLPKCCCRVALLF